MVNQYEHYNTGFKDGFACALLICALAALFIGFGVLIAGG